MELRHLRYFVAVAEDLHFSRAAARLHVAQPAVSEQVRKLEEELGVRLLNRSNGTVSLTEPGAVLLTEARRVLQQVEVARLGIDNVRHRAASRLRIATCRHLCLAASRSRCVVSPRRSRTSKPRWNLGSRWS